MVNLKSFAEELLEQCYRVEELEDENFMLREKLDVYEEDQRKLYVSMNESAGKILTTLLEKAK